MQADNPHTITKDPLQDTPTWEEFPESPPPGGEVKGKTQELAGQFKQAGKETIRRTREQGEAMIGEHKHNIASTMHDCSDALKNAAQSLREKQDPNVASFADAIAQRLENASSYLEGKQFNDIRMDLENFARQQPAVFHGAMFVAGLALSRFLKASQESVSESEPLAAMPGSDTFNP